MSVKGTSEVLARVEAIRHAMELIRDLDPSPDDLLVVADWLHTGTTDVAERFSEQNARNYGDQAGTDDEVTSDER